MGKIIFTKNCIWSITIMLALAACSNPADIQDEIAELNCSFSDYYNNGQMEKLGNCYTAEARLYPQNREIISGKANIIGFWEEIKQRGIATIELNTVVAERHNTIAFEEGEYRIFTQENKEADMGKYIVVWKMEDGQWKMHRAIWNTDQASTEYRLPDLLN